MGLARKRDCRPGRDVAKPIARSREGTRAAEGSVVGNRIVKKSSSGSGAQRDLSSSPKPRL